MEHVNTFKQTCSHWKVAQRQEVALKVDNSMVVIFGFSPFSDYETLKCVIVRAAVFWCFERTTNYETHSMEIGNLCKTSNLRGMVKYTRKHCNFHQTIISLPFTRCTLFLFRWFSVVFPIRKYFAVPYLNMVWYLFEILTCIRVNVHSLFTKYDSYIVP